MEDRKPDRFIDELLDASLQRYRSEEPRAGLENRILANVRTRDLAARRRAWTFAIAASAAMLMIAAVAAYMSRRQPAPVRARAPSAARKAGRTPKPQMNVASHTETAKLGTAGLRRLSERHAVTEPIRERSAMAHRPEQFPTPTPLSEEERLLLAYVASTPRSELSSPVTRDLEIEPLQIPEIKIARIEIEELPKLNE